MNQNSIYIKNRITKKKIFNDPIYGLIHFPFDFLYVLIDHPYVQRLRRIKQLGLTDYVYSGGSHSRFNHCLGALHLMTQALQILKLKGLRISKEEEEAVSIAILLHDIGHGPFSHALEGSLLPFDHEQLSIRIMEILNIEFGGKLTLAISIFKNEYEKSYLHQLVASQLDMDRMDYLNRDSFYTGVVEGMIGYDRIIKMLNVVDDELVVEEKGALSVEQFLMARRMMYWQVYLHKTVLSVEKMLERLIGIVHQSRRENFASGMTEPLSYFFRHFEQLQHQEILPEEAVLKFLELDDYDIISFLKSSANWEQNASKLLSHGILDRNIFKIILKNEPFLREFENTIRLSVNNSLNLSDDELDLLIIKGSESNATYKQNIGEIKILMKDGEIKPITEMRDILVSSNTIEKHYIIFPRTAE